MTPWHHNWAAEEVTPWETYTKENIEATSCTVSEHPRTWERFCLISKGSQTTNQDFPVSYVESRGEKTSCLQH